MAMISATTVTACTIAAVCSGAPVPTPGSSLMLSLQGSTGPESTVHLTCSPDAGTHPRAREACEALTRAGGDFERLPAKDMNCTMVYSPVRAHAHGHWHGEPVDYTTEYANRCVADARSGGVFGF